jgi:predicted outer membrane repeat protein
MSSSQSSQATISGDGSGAGLLFVSSLHSRVISLHLVRLLVTNFRSEGGNKNHIPCVHLNNLNKVTFDHVTLLSSAAGYLVFFLIDESNSIVLSNLLAKNNAASVIAISTVGSVTITGCAFRGNIVQTSYGAVVSIVQVQDLVIADTEVSDNTADSGFVFYLKDAVIAISRCKFTGNTLYICGPLYSSSVTSLTVSDSTFENNRALSSISVGGAVIVDSSESGTVSFTDCSFVNNTAQYFGGAIHVTYALLYVSKCSFERNSANLGGAVTSQGFSVIEDSSFNLNSATPVISNPLRYVPRGGAIFLINGTDCRVTRCSFTNNKAHAYGGAISAVALKRFYVVDCSLTDNYSGAYGGGISIEGGNSGSGYTIQRTYLTRNIAQMHGGGIYFSPLNYYISTVSCAFLNNRAIEGSGGAMYFERTCSKISIGGLNPKTLSIATASLYVIEDDTSSLLNYYGTLKIPRASGYYVIFDAKTVLLGNQYSNGIEITGVDGLAYQGRKFWEYEYKEEPVTEINDDIAAWPGIGGNSPLFVNGNVLQYKLHELTDHYIFTAYPILKNEPPNTFTGNTAALSGGAIYWGTANSEIFMMPGTQFTGNSVRGVEGSGGALFMHISNSLIYMFSSTFINNTAYAGGAITLSQSNYPMSLYQCTFTENSATKYGGAIYLGDGNGYGFFRMLTSTAIRFFDAVFNANRAGYSGGGAYISNSNALTFNNTVMSDNSADHSGGALHFEFKNIAAMNFTLLSRNTAFLGGAIQSSTGNSIAFDKITSFINNFAGYQGGALYAVERSDVSFLGETSFFRNSAHYGGAIFSRGSITTLGVESIVFEGNFAEQGSALIFEFLHSGQLIILPSTTTSITFLRNKCPLSSTVYWTKEPTASAIYDKNNISNFQRIVYLDNSALISNESSTQPTKLMFTDKNVSYTGAYNAEMLSHLNLSLFDYFNQIVITDYNTIVTVTVASSSCMNKVGYLSGTTAATVIRGATQLTQLSAFCFPGGKMTLDYTGEREILD